jgi:broad specificity phosphatase PhoE
MKNGTIWLIRHSTTEGVEKHWLYGWADLPLSESGYQLLDETIRQGIYPSADGCDLYSSGLTRATQTLQAIYPDTPFAVDEGFREMGVGDFECHTHEELLQMPGYWEWLTDETGMTASPNGESSNGFSCRVVAAMEGLIARQERNAIVVCHGGTIAAIMNALLPDGVRGFYDWIPLPAHGYALTVQDGKLVSHEPF